MFFGGVIKDGSSHLNLACLDGSQSFNGKYAVNIEVVFPANPHFRPAAVVLLKKYCVIDTAGSVLGAVGVCLCVCQLAKQEWEEQREQQKMRRQV